MELILYPKLRNGSRRAITRKVGAYGRPYSYTPQVRLLVRLSNETGMPIDEVYHQLLLEREFILKVKSLFIQ
jgi:hypothetical protein